MPHKTRPKNGTASPPLEVVPRTGRWVRGYAIRRLLLLTGGVGLSAVFSATAFAASPHQFPTITSSQATFKVPAGTTSTWTLRLWSHGTLKGSASGTSGVVAVAVPATTDCKFQADVKVTAPGRHPHYYSGTRARVTDCGVRPSTQSISGHIYLCTAEGSSTTTEVAGGTMAATGPQAVASQPNPLTPTAAAVGSYTMTANSPVGYLLVVCGGSASVGSAGQTASESVTVPSGGAGVGLFYASAPPFRAGGGSTVSNPASTAGGGARSSRDPVAVDRSPVPVTKATGSQLAFTGVNVGSPLLLGLIMLGFGTMLLAYSRERSVNPKRLQSRHLFRSLPKSR